MAVGWQSTTNSSIMNIINYFGIISGAIYGLLNKWTTKANMPTPREGAAASSYNDKIYVTGGSAPISLYFTTNEEYDTKTDTWATKQPMNYARSFCFSEEVNGKIYVIGGANSDGIQHHVESYNISTNTWTIEQSLPLPLTNMQQGASANDVIHAIGGSATIDGSTVVTTFMYRYYPAINQWFQLGNTPRATRFAGITNDDNNIYMTGGLNSGGVSKLHDRYTINTDTWATLLDMDIADFGLASASLHKQIYVIGGGNGGGKFTREYSKALNVWSSRANMNISKAYLAVAEIENKIYAIGGASTRNYVEEYK